MTRTMNAEEILDFADALRMQALGNGDDLNAANLFTHAMLMRKLLADKQSRDALEFLAYENETAN